MRPSSASGSSLRTRRASTSGMSRPGRGGSRPLSSLVDSVGQFRRHSLREGGRLRRLDRQREERLVQQMPPQSGCCYFRCVFRTFGFCGVCSHLIHYPVGVDVLDLLASASSAYSACWRRHAWPTRPVSVGVLGGIGVGVLGELGVLGGVGVLGMSASTWFSACSAASACLANSACSAF